LVKEALAGQQFLIHSTAPPGPPFWLAGAGKPRPLVREKRRRLSIPSTSARLGAERFRQHLGARRDGERKSNQNPEHTPAFRPESRRIDCRIMAIDHKKILTISFLKSKVHKAG